MCTIVINEHNRASLLWVEYFCPFGEKFSLGYGRCIIGSCDSTEISDSSDDSSESNEITTTQNPTVSNTPTMQNMTTTTINPFTTSGRTTPRTTNGTTPKTTHKTTKTTIKTSTVRPPRPSMFLILK